MKPAALSRLAAMGMWEAARTVTPSVEERDHVEVFFDRVLLRRDVVLVYRNQSPSHADYRRVKLVSYGSEQAIIRRSRFPQIPEVMPDMPGETNWAYELIGVVDGSRP